MSKKCKVDGTHWMLSKKTLELEILSKSNFKLLCKKMQSWCCQTKPCMSFLKKRKLDVVQKNWKLDVVPKTWRLDYIEQTLKQEDAEKKLKTGCCPRKLGYWMLSKKNWKLDFVQENLDIGCCPKKLKTGYRPKKLKTGCCPKSGRRKESSLVEMHLNFEGWASVVLCWFVILKIFHVKKKENHFFSIAMEHKRPGPIKK